MALGLQDIDIIEFGDHTKVIEGYLEICSNLSNDILCDCWVLTCDCEIIYLPKEKNLLGADFGLVNTPPVGCT